MSLQIVFNQPVSIKENPRINDWLRRVESEMRNTLAKMLAQSVQDFTKFKSGQIDPAEYMQWLDRYPVWIKSFSIDSNFDEFNYRRKLSASPCKFRGRKKLKRCSVKAKP